MTGAWRFAVEASLYSGELSRVGMLRLRRNHASRAFRSAQQDKDGVHSGSDVMKNSRADKSYSMWSTLGLQQTWQSST